MSEAIQQVEKLPTDVSLWKIEAAVMALIAEREETESEEEKAAIDAELMRYVEGEIRKVDGILHHLRMFRSRSDQALIEAERMRKIAAIWENRREHLAAITLRALQAFGIKRVEGVAGSLSVTSNPPSVEIYDPGLVPEGYAQYTGTIGSNAWGALRAIMGELGWKAWSGREDVRMERTLRKLEILRDLKHGGVAGARLVSDRVRLAVK